jgi:prolyl 4-hydroxylase
LLDVRRIDLPGMSRRIEWEIVRHVQSVLEAWTHQPLVLTSLYGIRTYKEGAILAPHVDRLPLVSSAISKYIVNLASEAEFV